MTARMTVVAGVLLTGVVSVGSMAGQTSKNPISTKPEGSTPNCTYSGSVSDGKATNSSACRPGTTPGTDPNQIAPVSPAQRFPFPGDTPSLQQNPAVPDARPAAPVATPLPTAPGSQPSSQSAGQRFPFPGETDNVTPRSGSTLPAAPAAASGAPALQDAGSSGDASSQAASSSSSSSSSQSQAERGYSSSSAGADLPDDNPNAPMPTPHRSLRKKLPKEKKELTPDEQEAEDVQIAGFYQNDGNYKAAYQRAKEAVTLVTDDPEAHLALGDAARKLGKLDEAKTSYQRALALDPVPKVRRAAERALKEMSGS